MSAARAKGTRGENFFLPLLRELHNPGVPHDDDHPIQRLDMVARPLRASDMDYVGTPWPVEAKHTAKPLFQQWARVARKKAGDNWVLCWKGDARTDDGKPLVLMPWAMYVKLVVGGCF